MEQFNATAVDTMAAAQGMWMSLSALAVTYAFSVVGAVLLIIAGYFIAGVAERAVRSGLKRVPGFDETLRRFFAKIARYAVLVLAGITVLGQFGVQTASILAAIGAIGLAIGLALQGTLQNIAAGVMLLVLRPFRVGEYIDTGNVAGTIQEIGLFATELKTFDGLFVLSPNSELWSTPVTNYTRNPQRMTEIKIGIGYDDDIEKALSIYRDLAAADARILDTPAPNTFVTELADSAVIVAIRYWTRTPDWFATRLDFTKAAKTAFDAADISIPYPQQEIVYRELKPQAEAKASAT